MKLALNLLEGKKTYFAGFAIMAHAVIEVLLGYKDLNSAFDEFMMGFGIVALRQGISKIK